ncbi:hypothetical protein D3C75_1149940 [compost metagenome]
MLTAPVVVVLSVGLVTVVVSAGFVTGFVVVVVVVLSLFGTVPVCGLVTTIVLFEKGNPSRLACLKYCNICS